MNQEDYKVLAAAEKKYVVQEKKERRLQKLLDAANKKIAQLESKVSGFLQTITDLTNQLSQFRSIREQLDNGKLKKENKELYQQNSFFKSLIAQHGLSHYLGGKTDIQKEQDVHR